MPEITVIASVYNTSQYLRESLESIINQSFTDFEILMINDGSTDDSGKICEEYAQKDSRITLIQHENKGVAAVRNSAISQIKTKYSIHVDTDDYIDKDYLLKLYTAIESTNADVAICDFYIFNDKNKTLHKQPKIKKPEDVVKEILSGNVHGILCNKLIRHNLFEKYNLNVIPDLAMCSDLMIVSELFMKIENLTYVEEPLYYYRVNKSSITQSRKKQSFLSLFKIAQELEKKLPKSPDFKKALNDFKIQIRRDVILLGKDYGFTNLFPETNPYVWDSKSIKNFEKILLWSDQNNYGYLTQFILFLRKVKKKIIA